MINGDNIVTEHPPKWFTDEPKIKEKLAFKQALAQYIIETDPKRKPPKATVTTYRAVLPYVHRLITRWRAVTVDNFNTGQHPAH